MTPTPAELEALTQKALGLAEVFRRRLTGQDPESAALLGLARAITTYDPAKGRSLHGWVYEQVRFELLHDRRGMLVAKRAAGEGQRRRGSAQLAPWEMIPLSLSMPVADDGGLLVRLEDLAPDPTGDAAAALVDRLGWEQLVRELPRPCDAVVYWWAFDDASQTEIGRRLGVSQQHVGRHLRRGLALLRQRLCAAR